MPVEGHSDASDDDHEWDLEMELLTLPASGGSVRQTQRLASRIARGCGQVPPRALELGKLPNDSHRERAMHRWASKQAWRRLLPTPFEFGLPRASNQIDEAIVPHSALLPHETFASLAVHTDLFNELLRGPPGQLENFWAKSAESLWFQQHPLRDEISHRPQLCIPAGLHGDEGGVFGSPNHALVLTWGSVVQELLTLDSRILFAGLLMNSGVPGKTLETLYQVFVWSLNCLAAGVYPEADHTGKPFSEDYTPSRYRLRGQRLHQTGLRGIWSELRGDWKWQVESLRLDQHYHANYICHLRRARCKIERLRYTQFGRTAYVRRTKVRWSSFRDWYADRFSKPEFFSIVGFNIWRRWCDAMHCLDLGVYQSVAGSCLTELVEEGVWGSTDGDGYMLAHVEYKEWCRARGLPPAPRFEKSRLCRTAMDFPKFTQQSAKASATKHIMRWLRDVLHRVDHAGSTLHGKQRLAMMDAFAAFESICERHGRWIPADDVEAMGGFMETALLCLNALAGRAAEQNKFTWQIIPKCHMATHLRLRRLLLRCKPKEDHLLRRRGHGRPLQEDHGEVPRQDCRQQPCAEVQHPCLHAVVDETTAVSRASSFLMPHRTVRHHPGCFLSHHTVARIELGVDGQLGIYPGRLEPTFALRVCHFFNTRSQRVLGEMVFWVAGLTQAMHSQTMPIR